MTEKQKKIIKTALSLFATHGYDGISTYKVAKAADVSQGLIFRHFKNKEGLLKAILEQGESRARAGIKFLNEKTSAKEKLIECVEILNRLTREQRYYWRLLYSLKWQSNNYSEDYIEYMRPVVEQCFEELAYQEPQLEADQFMIIISGFISRVLLNPKSDLNKTKEFIFTKYQLN